MKLYLAGPMTGYPELNFPAFHVEAARLRELGFDIVNPAEINADPSAGWLDCMRADIKQLVDCDGVALLDGWESSEGASLEHYIAQHLGLAIFRAKSLRTPRIAPQIDLFRARVAIAEAAVRAAGDV